MISLWLDAGGPYGGSAPYTPYRPYSFDISDMTTSLSAVPGSLPEARILADSLNTVTGDRLTSFLVRFPRWILAEINTHRALSRNTASSRAIPIAKQKARVLEHPALPVEWGSNKAGMQAGEPIPEGQAQAAEAVWRRMAGQAVEGAGVLEALRVHKQITNRVLEPWIWTTSIISGTDWENFFALRCHPAAQPELQYLADEMLFAYVESTPALLEPGEWHLPFGDRLPAGLTVEDQLKVVTARCARTSYETFDGEHSTEKDIRLHDDLARDGHMSPFEHPAQAMSASEYSGNFRGWRQYRKTFPSENRTVNLTALAAERRSLREQR